tara:strand:- start:4267 stop:5391 length:1125 start_codon:yes stop_codon:yes gene_type:complete
MFEHLAANPNISKGRFYEEFDNDNTRTPYDRDRSRVIHSSSFRKLKHKTQVFIESDSDYYRTRLTHSLEVAQISRSLCRLLNLNEDLGETVALAHDLGHPPFGHSGEKALNYAMTKHGGFNHNDQTLRVLTFLERKHPSFDGLNLTWESLEGIVKHNGIITNKVPFHTLYYNSKFDLELNLQPHLESQIASISDDIAYNNHDVEDAFRAGLIKLDQLNEISFLKDIIEKLKQKYKGISEKLLIYQVLRINMSKMINDIFLQTKNNIIDKNIKDIKDLKLNSKFIVSFSDDMKKKCLTIRNFLHENVYNHNNLIKKRENAEKIIIKLFNYFESNTYKLPNDWINNNKSPIERIICDYISGMTDRFASKLYKEIYE